MNVQPSVDNPPADDAPLSEEQVALYRSRLESGYYRSAAVLKHISERLTDEFHPPEAE